MGDWARPHRGPATPRRARCSSGRRCAPDPAALRLTNARNSPRRVFGRRVGSRGRSTYRPTTRPCGVTPAPDLDELIRWAGAPIRPRGAVGHRSRYGGNPRTTSQRELPGGGQATGGGSLLTSIRRWLPHRLPEQTGVAATPIFAGLHREYRLARPRRVTGRHARGDTAEHRRGATARAVRSGARAVSSVPLRRGHDRQALMTRRLCEAIVKRHEGQRLAHLALEIEATRELHGVTSPQAMAE